MEHLRLEEGGQFGFSKNDFFRETVKFCFPVFFYVTFDIVISHIFPENFAVILQVAQKLWGIYSSMLIIFTNFLG